MVVTRKARLAVSAAAAMAATVSTAAWGAGQAVATGPVPAPVDRRVAREADVSHHGHVSLWGRGLGIWLHSENHGPSNLASVTVRFRFSVPLSGRQEMPVECLQASARSVLCRTGPLRADGSAGRQLALELQLAGRPNELVVRIDTAWNGGATDRNPGNNRHEVLAPATDDEYVF